MKNHDKTQGVEMTQMNKDFETNVSGSTVLNWQTNVSGDTSLEYTQTLSREILYHNRMDQLEMKQKGYYLSDDNVGHYLRTGGIIYHH